MPYGRKKCDGGMDLNTALGNCVKPKLKCKVETRTCYKWVECSVGGPGEMPPPQLTNSVTVRGLSNNCKEFHGWANIVCCQYEC